MYEKKGLKTSQIIMMVGGLLLLVSIIIFSNRGEITNRVCIKDNPWGIATPGCFQDVENPNYHTMTILSTIFAISGIGVIIYGYVKGNEDDKKGVNKNTENVYRITDELTKLKQLKESGTISEQDYESLKNSIMKNR